MLSIICRIFLTLWPLSIALTSAQPYRATLGVFLLDFPETSRSILRTRVMEKAKLDARFKWKVNILPIQINVSSTTECLGICFDKGYLKFENHSLIGFLAFYDEYMGSKNYGKVPLKFYEAISTEYDVPLFIYSINSVKVFFEPLRVKKTHVITLTPSYRWLPIVLPVIMENVYQKAYRKMEALGVLSTKNFTIQANDLIKTLLEPAGNQTRINQIFWVPLAKSEIQNTILQNSVSSFKHFPKSPLIVICRTDDLAAIVKAANLSGILNGDHLIFHLDMKANKDFRSCDTGSHNVITRNTDITNLLRYVITLNIPLEPSSERKNDLIMDLSQNTSKNVPNLCENNYDDLASMYDTLMMQAKLINQSSGKNYSNVHTLLLQNEYDGITGNIKFDERGERVYDYVANIYDQNLNLIPIYKFNPTNAMPHQEMVIKNQEFTQYIANFISERTPNLGKPKYVNSSFGIAFLVILFVTLIIGGIFISRKKKTEKVAPSLWLINFDDIEITNKIYDLSIICHSKTYIKEMFYCPSNSSIIGSISTVASERKNPKSKTGIYRGNEIFIKRIGFEGHIELDSKLLSEVDGILKTSNHDNLIQFIGLSLKPGQNAIINEYCSKGNLQNFFRCKIDMDLNMKYSIIMDIINGMDYLHKSPIQLHGNLRSDNCLLNSNFVVKICNFGLGSLMAHNYIKKHRKLKNLSFKLWEAPEFLRMEIPPILGTKKGDIYSFGIVAQEIILRSPPYSANQQMTDDGADGIKLEDIIARITTAPSNSMIQPYRPIIPEETCTKDVRQLIYKCWSENPESRPDFDCIKQQFKMILRRENVSENYVTNILNRMESYNRNLEDVIKEKSDALVLEKDKTESILLQILPKPVMEALKMGKTVFPESFDCVTVCFSEVINFLEFSTSSSPNKIVKFLNQLYTIMDAITEMFDVYKVETIRDSYMVASGLPVRNGDKHSSEIAKMTLHIMKSVAGIRVDYLQIAVEIKIGIHSGPCAAGVVGVAVPRYCLFGDTINTASRMESSGVGGKIQISQMTKTLLDSHKIFVCEERGDMEIKGKGTIRTFWLVDVIEN